MTKKVLVLLILAMAGLCGCVASEGVPAMPASPEHVGIRMNSVAILDRGLQQWYVYEASPEGPKEYGKIDKISVEGTGSRRTPTNTVEAWTILGNRSDYPLQVEARVQFFDASRAPVEGPTAWQRLMLGPNATVPYRETSTGVQDIAYFYIEIREGG